MLQPGGKRKAQRTVPKTLPSRVTKMGHVKRQVDNIINCSEDRRQYRGLELDNEMKVLLICDQTAEFSAASIDIRVGHMSDPIELPGLAHLCEHVLFLGSEKYPDEDECSKFLMDHGGDSNADTSADHTNYYFHILPEYFRDALDRFANCLKHPLFTEGAIERETEVVNEEHENNVLKDSWRLDQLEKSTSKENHPFNKFGTGNKLTLDINAKENHISIHDELKAFHSNWYSSNIFSLCVLSCHNLDYLEKLVIELFSDVENKNVVPPIWTEHPFGPDQLQLKCYVVPVRNLKSLDITFPTPDLDEFYHAGPGHFISHLVEHEGSGSLLNLLREKGWCNFLDAEARTGYRGFGFFGLDIELTDEGSLHVNEIIKIIFQYFNLIRQNGIIESIFNEFRDIMEMQFRLKDEQIPMSYVANLAENLNLFPMEEVLSGDYLFREWRPDLINMVMNCLTPENVRIAVISKSYEEEANEVEKWYGTKYKLEKIPRDLINSWKNAGLCEQLSLPVPNEFVTNDFRLYPRILQPREYPTVIRDTPFIRVWFKQDDEFLLPKSELTFEFVSSLSYMDPLNCNMTNVFVGLLEESLAHYTRLTEIGGISWGIDHTKYGMILEIGGCSGKQHLLLEKIMEKFTTIKPQENLYEKVVDNYVRELLNVESLQPMDHAVVHLEILLEEKAWTKEELLAAVEEMTIDKLGAFIPQMLSKIHVECLIHGNADEERALYLAQIVEESLKSSFPLIPLLPTHLLRNREYQLMQGCNFAIEVFNTVHCKSCVAIYFQSHLASLENNVLLELFVAIIKEPCFSTLKTNDHLPFITSCDIRKSNGVHGLRIIAHSEKHPIYAERSIETFLINMESYIHDMPIDDFEKIKSSLAAHRLSKAKTLASLTSRYWTEIMSQEYNFNRDYLDVEQLRKIKKQDIIRFYERVIHYKSPQRCKITVRVMPNIEGIPGDMVPPEGALLDAGFDAPPGYKEPTVIDDITHFKASLAMFPRVMPFIDIQKMISEIGNAANP